MEGGPNIQVSTEDEETCCDRTYHLCCHPSGKAHRFLALIFMCILGFGSYFCYDNPSALQKQFKQDLNLTETQFTALYSVYSWPNVVMCFVGGFLIDQVFGIRAGANIFMGLTLIGQLLFTAAVYVNQYWLMIVGRFVFGVGSESLAVAQNNYAVLWFKGKELNMVFGLQMSIARMGSTVNFWLMEPIYQWVSSATTGTRILGLSLLIASATCLFSTVCSIILGFMDKRAEQMTRRSESRTSEVVRITDAKHFKGTFWLVTCICVTYYNAIFPFISLAQQFFIQRFQMNVKDADHISSLIYLISGIISPFTGLLIDKIGLNVLWILISTVGTIVAHLLLGFTACDPYIGVIILGVAYSVLASGLWPLVAIIIPEYQLGTAYGVCQAVQNLGLAIVSIITGSIVDKWGFRVLSLFFLGNLFMAFMFTSILLIIDQRERGVLNLTPRGRKRHQEVLLEETVQRQILLSAEQLPVDVESPSAQESADNSVSDNTRLRNRYISAVAPELT